MVEGVPVGVKEDVPEGVGDTLRVAVEVVEGVLLKLEDWEGVA